MLVVVADGGQKVGDMVVMQLVTDVAAIAAGVYEAQRAQQPEVVRGGAEAERGGGSEVLDRALSAKQLGQNPQPAG